MNNPSGDRQSEQVRFYDPETRRVVNIPKAELSQTAIFVNLAGHGAAYIDAREAKFSDKMLHPPFEGEEKEAIELLVKDLADVRPMNYKQWEDGFRTELRPRKEIDGWLLLRAILEAMTDHYGFDFPKRKECLGLLIACFNGERETVASRCTIKLLSHEEVELAVNTWYRG